MADLTASSRKCRCCVLIRLVALLLALGMSCASAAEIAGIRFPETANVAGYQLVLNGAALRSRAMLRIYAIGLYVSERNAGAADLLSQPGPKRVTLALLRDTTSKELTDALIDGINDNQAPTEAARLRPRMDRLASVMAAVGFAPSGSQITIDFVPGRGTRFALNGEQTGETIEGAEFYAALLNIWLGDHPPQPSIKDALLGRVR